MAWTINSAFLAAALNGATATLNGGSFRLLTAGSSEIASLPFGNPAFQNASVTGGVASAQSNGLTPDTSVTAPSTIGRVQLRDSSNTVMLEGLVAASGSDMNMTVSVPEGTDSISCTNGIILEMTMA